MRTFTGIWLAILLACFSPQAVTAACVDWSTVSATPVSTISLDCFAYGVYWADTILIVTDEADCPEEWPGGGDTKLRTYDVSNAAAPVALSVRDVSYLWEPWRIGFTNDYAFLESVSGTDIWDLGTPSAPAPAGVFPSNRTRVAGDLLLSGGQLPSGGEYVLYDVSTPASPDSVGEFSLPGSTIESAMNSSFAYCIHRNPDRLYVVDITDPTSPLPRGSLAISPDINTVSLWGEHIYGIQRLTTDVHVFDVGDPDFPVAASTLSMPTQARSTGVGHGILYVSDNTGVAAFSLASPELPVLLGRIELGYFVVRAVGPEHILVHKPFTEDLLIFPAACDLPTGVPAFSTSPTLAISAPVPNPSKRSVSFEIRSSGASASSVNVYDARGRHVVELFRGVVTSGRHLTWNGRDATGNAVTSGMYFVRAHSSESSATQKLVLRRD